MVGRPDREGVYVPVFHLLERWHELPPIRWSVEELLAENASMESFVTSLDVKIRNTDMDLRHKFVYVPLVYSRETMDLDFQEMERERQVRGSLPTAGHSFNNFKIYNTRVNDLVRQTYPNSRGYLADPNELLAVETLKTSTHVFGKSYDLVRYQFRLGNHSRDDKLMNDRALQNYFVYLIRWVKETFKTETREEMARTGVPNISVNLRLAKHYTSNTQIA